MTGAEKNKIKVLKTKTGQCLQELEHSPGADWYHFAFSKDCKRFAASCSKKYVIVWNLIDGSCGAKFDLANDYGVYSLAFSNDGICLAFGTGSWVTVISNVLGPQSIQIKREESTSDDSMSILFLRDSDHLLLSSRSGMIQIRDMSGFERLQTSEPQP